MNRGDGLRGGPTGRKLTAASVGCGSRAHFIAAEERIDIWGAGKRKKARY